MVRCDPLTSETLLRQSGVSRMVMQGRELHGWLLVDAEHTSTDELVGIWVGVGTAYAQGLPAG